MMNGDISNIVIEQICFVDGKGFLYLDLPGLKYRFLRWLATKVKSTRLMLRAIGIERRGLAALMHFVGRHEVRLRVLTFTEEEKFAVNSCILEALELEALAHEVRTADEFKTFVGMSNTVMSNHYADLQLGRRSFFLNVQQAILILSDLYGFKGR